MKYVDLATFMQMPAGTLYMIEENAKSPLSDFNQELRVKGDTIDFGPDMPPSDWAEAHLIDVAEDDESGANIDAMMDDGAEFPLDEELQFGRHGMFPRQGEVMFWVLDEKDHETLIAILHGALAMRRQK